MNQARPNTGEQTLHPSRLRFRSRIAIAVGLVCAAASPKLVQAQQTCGAWQAQFVSVEGDVELQADGSDGWRPVGTGSSACRGDLIRVGPFARAALRLPDDSVFRLDQNTQLRLPEPASSERNLIDLLRGIIHIISRDPRELSFATPYMNAGLEGTEFVLAVDGGGAGVTVLEGAVSLDAGNTRIDVMPGQRGSASAGTAPTAERITDPFAATGWTPYSAVILTDARVLPRPDASVDQTAEQLVLRAASRLQRGRFEAAGSDLTLAAGLDPTHPGVAALRAMIALADGEKPAAGTFARQSIDGSPGYAPGWLAYSYVAQAGFDYETAVDHARKAVSLAPASAVALTRLAELELATDRYRDASAHVAMAVQLDPAFGQAHAVQGFAHLTTGALESAIASLRTAAELDPGSPVPRFGAALALARSGDEAGGRRELEIAVVLDPTNAAVRSMMAKIYADEGRIELAETQLDLAQALDPADPTSSLYRAVIDRRANSLVDALVAFDRAATLNGDSPLFQTNLRLDDDTAMREFSFSRLYTDLGFFAWAQREGWEATAEDPADYAGHRLLSDSYARLPRHESARVDEHFQARLLQPLTQNPLAPQLGEPNLYLLDDLGPSRLTASEFIDLVPANGIRVRASGVGAGLDTGGYDFELAGLNDRVSYGFGHMYFETDGFRPNNDLEQRVSNAYVQFQPNATTSMIAELRHSDADQGSMQLLFDSDAYSRSLRQSEAVDSLRLGLRRTLHSGTLLVSADLTESETTATTGPAFALSGVNDSSALELQYIQPFGRWSLTTGIYRWDYQEDHTTTLLFLPPGAPPGTPPISVTLPAAGTADALSAYAYGTVDITDRLAATIGLSADRVEDVNGITAHGTNPKLGVRFRASKRTTLRASLTGMTQDRIMSRRGVQPRLEPTHVWGLNQIFDGTLGEQAWRLGAAIDHRINDQLFAGLEVSLRDSNWPTTALMPDGSTVADEVTRKELLQHGFVHWIASDRITLSAGYQRDRFDIEGESLIEGFSQLDTDRIPIELNYFPDSRIRAGVRLTLVRQSGRFSTEDFGPTDGTFFNGSDRFAVLDLSAAYRLRGGRGELTLSVDNALDERFSFQDIDPMNPTIIPARVIALRFTVAH